MTAIQTHTVLQSQALLDHWQGHRRLTRRVIEAFPEDKLFSFTVGSMRPFSEMAKEFLNMTEPIVHGVATGEWSQIGRCLRDDQQGCRQSQRKPLTSKPDSGPDEVRRYRVEIC